MAIHIRDIDRRAAAVALQTGRKFEEVRAGFIASCKECGVAIDVSSDDPGSDLDFTTNLNLGAGKPPVAKP